MDFRKEFEAYKREHPYRGFPVQGGRFRYILSGESGKPAIVFLNGLDMQEAWLLYMIAFEQEYRVLMMEYPLSCATTDALLDAIVALLKELGMPDCTPTICRQYNLFRTGSKPTPFRCQISPHLQGNMP